MENKFVLITGATGGLGVAVTEAVLKRNPRQVTITYRQEESLSFLLQRLTPSEISKLKPVACDVTDETQVRTMVAQMSQVDVLIHLVGGFDMGYVEDFSFHQWQYMFTLNLHSTFLLAKYCLPKMKQTGYGRIVAVASRAAVQPTAQLSAYGAAKAGVCNLIATIAEETKAKHLDITANTVLPSIIDTPKNRETMEFNDNWVSPQSLSEVICFLASEAARDIRGATIPVYGKA
ncbi:MAG: 3-oxoacyl-ACP reductase FabG [Geminocystis sp.]|nr:3-oxoacyl-ACP reductase FabG [Geminocystis sp.]HIK38517.1 3-oxoacyl-ACP reductase FabG [Geminocystis sp. M7585_C2015_104]MCS7147530.1 3-oxoacyl-ACP reductase FabG [Geminocystis sp.]MCX8077933.1 3-oxoacyl-ACP reductase FabG [Geminocystis sp.]MDW8115223.1 3-oxoacyl-ACP reductase FabG [Geminocystis sp.]